MIRFALCLVAAGFGLILSLVATMLGGLLPEAGLALPVALGAPAAAIMLVGGLFLLESRSPRTSQIALG